MSNKYRKDRKMTTTSRQNNLILNQDWTRIYQTFKNADFKSYDFENLRRVILTYLRENYPEDFNDYIESSEYMALIDAVAFLGQSLSFRIDLASRENFLELADRKESVLRLARMLSYNAKRNLTASGLLKFTSISTSEEIFDANGRNLADQIINWNDPTNSNWLEQFLLVLNASMSDNTEFGRNQGSATIQGIPTEQYRFRSAIRDVPLFSFNKTVASRGMIFEMISTSFRGQEYIYEEPPVPGNQIGFIYRQDGRGPSSANTGFFMMFKQGSLEVADFSIDAPTINERVAVNAENINNDDLWLFSINSSNVQQEQWQQVSSLIGSNIAYNSIANDIRNIYSVITKENDSIDLLFADGVYGNLPRGNFRVYYRISNGLNYSITPAEMRGISISIPYISKAGALENLSVTLGLNYTINNSTPSEDIDTIKQNAPAVYYTQNRMITAEDYQLAPLSSSQEILKVKSINRISSGVSRNFDLIDSSGKYSSINVFADDGYIYKEETETNLNLKFTNRIEILNFLRNDVEEKIKESAVYDFYLTKYDKILFLDEREEWVQVTSGINQSTGYFKNRIDDFLLRVGSFSTSSLKYMVAESLIKFTPPTGKRFKNNELVDENLSDPDQRSYVWTKVVRIVGDGTNSGRGVLTNGTGPIIFSDVVPSGAIANRIVPRFVNIISQSLEIEIINQLVENQNFGLRYDINDTTWKIIDASNIDLINSFNLGKTGDTTRNNLDSSWIVSFVKRANEYNIRIRGLEYRFGSLRQNRFYVDSTAKIYDIVSARVVKDNVKVLGVNASEDLISPLIRDIDFSVAGAVKFEDGFERTDEIKISFLDRDDDGVIDDPESFEAIVGGDLNLRYLFFKEIEDDFGNFGYQLVTDEDILLRQRESQVNLTTEQFVDGQLIYFYDSSEDRLKRFDAITNTLVLESFYKANIGRTGLKFQYLHNASDDRRIDPSASNIIDVYLLTRGYDLEYRNFLAGGTITAPDAPTNDTLRIVFGSKLDSIKSISDEIIYHPARYKVLFGSSADEKLQARFKVVKNKERSINDNDLKVRIISSMNEFFDINNWDFGDRFYLGELTTYILNSVSPDVTNIAIIPKQTTQIFGNLFEIQSRSDEIFISGATVDDIEIVNSINAAEVQVDSNRVIGNNGITSSGSSGSSSGSSGSSGSGGGGYY